MKTQLPEFMYYKSQQYFIKHRDWVLSVCNPKLILKEQINNKDDYDLVQFVCQAICWGSLTALSNNAVPWF